MDPLECSFCGKQESQVQRLIGGWRFIAAEQPLICDECVARCQTLLDEPAPEPRAPASKPPDSSEMTLDRLRLVLREIGSVPLLTAEQEVELAERIERGDVEAKTQMVAANRRYVVSIAKGYLGKGLPFLDLIQEGTLALVRASERFDHRTGMRFADYAAVWVRQTMAHALARRAAQSD